MMIRKKKINPKGGSISQADLARLPENARRQIEIQLGKLDAASVKAATPLERKKVETKRRSLLARIGTRLRLIASTKKYKIEARNLNKAPRKTIKIRARTETDALSKARKQLGPGFDSFRIKNPSRGVYMVSARKNSGFVFTRPFELNDSQLLEKYKSAKKEFSKAEKQVTASRRAYYEAEAKLDQAWKDSGGQKPPQAIIDQYKKAKAESENAHEYKARLDGYLTALQQTIKERGQYKKNPGRKHLTKASAKQQRQYEHILSSELKAGRSRKVSKRIAAATVRKGQKKNPNEQAYIGDFLGVKMYTFGGTAYAAPALKLFGFSSERALKTAIKKKKSAKNPRRKTRKIGDVWIETRGTTQGNEYVVFVATASRPEGVRVAESRDKKQAEWEARAYRKQQKLKSNPRPKRRNDGAEDRREQFAGKVTGHKDLYFPSGSPGGLSTLGPLVKISTDIGELQPTSGHAFLAQDGNEKLYVGSAEKKPLATTDENFGHVHRVEYKCRKPHLGYPDEIIWFHDFESPLPRLVSDSDGALHFEEGHYRIKREGIVG